RRDNAVAAIPDDLAGGAQLPGGTAGLQRRCDIAIRLEAHVEQIDVVVWRLAEADRLASLGLVAVGFARSDLQQQDVALGNLAIYRPRTLVAADWIEHRLAGGQHHARYLAALALEGLVNNGEQVLLVHPRPQLFDDRVDRRVADTSGLLDAADLFFGEDHT